MKTNGTKQTEGDKMQECIKGSPQALLLRSVCTNTPKQWFRLADPLQTISFIKKESLKSNLESRDGICFHNSEFIRPILLLEIL